MTMLYSKSAGGFYHRDVHGEAVPADVVEISDEHHIALLEAQSQGKVIVADENGMPAFGEPGAYQPSIQEQIASAERRQTARLMREAQLGYPEALNTLRNIDNEIAALRQQLPNGS